MSTRLGGEPRRCPVTYERQPCQRTVRAGHLMCPAHWRLVPAPQRRAVTAAWKNWCTSMTDELWTAYLTARQAALDTLETR